MIKDEKVKASVFELNALHGLVAKELASNLEDPRNLALAIKFLKDNNITADILESESMMSLQDSIKKIAKESKDTSSFSVDEMLKIADY